MSRGSLAGTSLSRDAWNRFRRNRVAMAGLYVVLVVAILGFFSPILSRHVTGFSLDEQHNEYRLKPPGFRDVSKDYTTFDGDKDYFHGLDIDGDGVIGEMDRFDNQWKARFFLFLFDDYDLISDGEDMGPERRLMPHPDGYLVEAEYPGGYDELNPSFRDEFASAVTSRLPPNVRENPMEIEPAIRTYWRRLGLDRDWLFSEVDLDGDRLITPEEVAIYRLPYRIFESQAWVGRTMDLDGDGIVSRDEYPGLPQRRTFYLGTDHLGRDVLTRILFGARISITIALLATLVSFFIGVTWGSVAGFYGGRTDSVMMRIVDVLYGLPFMFIVILLIVIFGRSTINLFIALGAVQWLTMSRVVRGQVLSLKHREFVEAATALGVPRYKILFRHLLRNTVGPVIVYSTLMIPSIILEEAFLSFLGLGVQPPDPSWGNMITDGAKVMDTYPWLILYPGIALSLTLFSMNFVGDGVRDALDPQVQKS